MNDFTDNQKKSLLYKQRDCCFRKEKHKITSLKYDKLDKLTGLPQVALSAFLSSLSVSNYSETSSSSDEGEYDLEKRRRQNKKPSGDPSDPSDSDRSSWGKGSRMGRRQEVLGLSLSHLLLKAMPEFPRIHIFFLS